MAKPLDRVKKALQKAGVPQVEAHEWRRSVVLTGKVSTWDEKIRAGLAAARKGYRAVVNDIEVPGIKTDEMSVPSFKDTLLEGKYFDVVVIGGGVIGSAIARELSRYDIKIALLEKEEDLGKHASGRNDGVIHPSFAAKPGSKRAHYNMRGNRAYTQVCRELGVDFRRDGALLLFPSLTVKAFLPYIYLRSRQNGSDGYEYLSKKKVKEMVPYVTPKQLGAFYFHSGGVLSPFKITVAYAENAVENGAEVFFHTAVLGFDMDRNHIAAIQTNRGKLRAGVVVNAAGIWADKIAEYADDRFFSLHGRKGVDAVLDIKTGKFQPLSMAMPTLEQRGSRTKGGGLVTTTEGNLIIGPNAKEVPFREEYSTEPEDIEEVLKHLELNTKLKKSDIIAYFAGIRACTYEEDFIIEASDHIDNLVYAAGIQSPGLASAPAIAEDVSKIAVDVLKKTREVKPNSRFNPNRKTTPVLKHLPFEERAEVIRSNPSYGRIVCRCEQVSEGEVRDALGSVIPATTLDGLKRRVRVGSGRCQGGFCTPRVLEIMSEELDIKMTDIKKKGDLSELFYRETKGTVDYSNKKLKKREA
jgi:glycerol-3-phosphate dehydrogenase